MSQHIYLTGTDIPAVDGLKGQGSEPGFNRYATASGNREINASDKKDLMFQIGAFMRTARSGGVSQRADAESAQQRFADFKAAFDGAKTDGKPFAVLGEVFTDEIWETLGREGFTGKVLATENIQRGATGRIRVRKKDIFAFQITSDVRIQEQRIRQDWIYPPEFTIGCNIVIEDKEIAQASADILDEKFQDGLEAQLVREDKITKALLDRASTSFNDLVFYTNFNPTIATTIRTQVNRWSTPAATMLIAWDVWDDILSDPDFVAAFDQVTKHELVLEGTLGKLYGLDLHTDGLRYPTLQVLQPGDIYVTGSPVTVGAKTIRKELESVAINKYNEGRAARGWFIQQIQGQIIGNGRAVAAAKRLP